MTHPARITITTIALAASVFGLAACGGKSSSTSTKTTAAAAAATASALAGARGEFSDPKVQTCLKAAGITVPTFANRVRPSGSARPSGSFTGFPSGERPSGFPTGARPSGAGGAFGNSAEAAKIQAALKACGITLTGRGARPSGSATPTTTPTAAPSS